MRKKPFIAVVVCASVAALLSTGVASASRFGPTSRAGLVHLCVFHDAHHAVRYLPGTRKCHANESELTINGRGVKGATGPRGTKGPAGPGSVGAVYTVPASSSGGYLQLTTAGSDYELDLTCNYGAPGDNETLWFADQSSHSASVVETFIDGGVGGVYAFPTVDFGQGGTDRVNPTSWPYQATFTINEDSGTTLTRWDVTATGSSGGACTYTVYQNGNGSVAVRP
jgi:hypothetical protein